MVGDLVADAGPAPSLQAALAGMSDLERLAGRVAARRLPWTTCATSGRSRARCRPWPARRRGRGPASLRALGDPRPALAAFAETSGEPLRSASREAAPASARRGQPGPGGGVRARCDRRRLAGDATSTDCAASPAWPGSSWSRTAPRGSSWRCRPTRARPAEWVAARRPAEGRALHHAGARRARPDWR